MSMLAVTLDRWERGFNTIPLAKLLQSHGFGLAEAYRMSCDFVEGGRVTVVFENPDQGNQFADSARSLHAQVTINPAGLAANVSAAAS